jgi:hypothetical protein
MTRRGALLFCVLSLAALPVAAAQGKPKPPGRPAAMHVSRAPNTPAARAPGTPDAAFASALAQADPPKETSLRLLLPGVWVLVTLWLLGGIAGGFLYRKRFAASWRAPKLRVPVVAIDSDDWGLDFRMQQFVPGSDQLDAQQAEGVRMVTEMLLAHRDSVGRNPILNAFIVVRQADTPAIANDPEFRYHARPIDQAMPNTVAELKRAESEGAFHLTYHARDHRNTRLWVDQVRQAVERCRTEAKPFDPDIVRSFLTDNPNRRDRLIGEYFDNLAGYLQPPDQAEVDADVRDGLAEFERIFGRRPISTVAPRYLWGAEAESAFAAGGIRYLHGVDREGGRYRSPHDVAARPFGMRLGHDLIGVTRNTDLESDPARNSFPQTRDVLAQAARALADGQPVVLSTHSQNFTSGDPAIDCRMADQLDEILSALESMYPNLRYLSADELGLLAETGCVSVRVDEKPTGEIRVASGLRRAWLSARHIHRHRTKARLYVGGLALLVLCAVAATIVSLL